MHACIIIFIRWRYTPNYVLRVFAAKGAASAVSEICLEFARAAANPQLALLLLLLLLLLVVL